MTQNGERIDVDAVLGRLKDALCRDAHTPDRLLGETIGVPRATIASWRKRESIPLEKLIAVCRKFSMSMDWILSGNGKARPLILDDNSGIDVECLEIAMFDYLDSSRKNEESGILLPPIWFGGRVVIQNYLRTLSIVDQACGRLQAERSSVLEALRLERGISSRISLQLGPPLIDRAKTDDSLS